MALNSWIEHGLLVPFGPEYVLFILLILICLKSRCLPDCPPLGAGSGQRRHRQRLGSDSDCISAGQRAYVPHVACSLPENSLPRQAFRQAATV